jgi:PTS system N-acetylglucosamine-specific IIC component
VNIGTHGMQVVVGPIADQVAGEMRARIAARGAPAARLPGAEWVAALGGAGNIASVESRPGRVLVTVQDAARVDAKRLEALGARGVASPTITSVHVLHADAEALGAELAALVG